LNILQRFVKYVFFSKSQKYLLELYNHGYLYERGFVKSKETGEVVFQDGSPAPWLSYPFLDFFLPRLTSSTSIFEYGMGNSTLCYDRMVDQLYAIEHDPAWFQKIHSKLLNSQNYKLVDEGDFVRSISLFERRFKVIIIDGLLRNECMTVCVDYLEEDGVIILDDSEREEYQTTMEGLQKRGFRSLGFVGMKAFGRHATETTLFYRSANWLNI